MWFSTLGLMSHGPLNGDTVMTLGLEKYGILLDIPPSQQRCMCVSV